MFLNGNNDHLQSMIHKLIDDKIIDYKLYSLSLDFIVKNMLVSGMFAYISINFQRNFAGLIIKDL